MADIENVIKAWNCCNPFNRKCKECPYEKDCYHDGISRHMVADAVAMLKSQQAEIERLQPKKGKWIEIESQTGVGAFGFNEVTVNAFRCSECRKKIDVSDGNFKYCPYCGAKMELVR